METSKVQIKNYNTIHILFPINLDIKWMGGVNYYKNLFTAIKMLNEKSSDNILLIYINEPNDENLNQIFSNYASYTKKEVYKPFKYYYKKFYKKLLGKEFQKEKYIKYKKYDKFDITSHNQNDFIENVPALSWIPDFQHICLPEMFSKEEIVLRDEMFRKQIDNARLVILSSEDAKKDLEKFSPNDTVKARVLHFVADIAPEIYQKTDDIVERFELVTERISTIKEDHDLPEKLQAYFNQVADFFMTVLPIMNKAADGTLFDRTITECENDNDAVFAIYGEDTYKNSFLCPTYAVAELGQELGGPLSAIFYEMTNIIEAAFAGRLDKFTIYAELFLQIYGECQMEEEDKYRKEGILDAMYSAKHDYAQLFMSESIISMIDADYDYYRNIIMKDDLSDDRYMYKYGMYIGPNERKIAAHLRSLPHEDVVAMARTYVEGYIKGFEVTGKDITIKDTVGVHAPVGFELMTREAIRLFDEAGLASTVRFGGMTSRNLYSSVPNKQCEYDHKDDRAYYWDKGMADRMLEVLKNTFEKNKELAAVFGGPAVIETFGEKPFEPVNHDANAKYSDKQNELNVYFASQNGQITNEYIHGEERSFTIIAYPIPEIGKDFNEIFNETVAVNTMDYELYKNIQQHIIDVLDQGETVHITGRGDNHTDITVKLHHLDNPAKQTNFENCVADVNIPVGEVFTSPKLTGTKGILNVSEVYLNELKYKNIKITFEDGRIKDYTCDNFETEAENKAYFKENVMFNRDTLPIGEFAIGTNTTAYVLANRFDIVYMLPILIAEKMGPHFAVGDTCYSRGEELKLYNPDGKEIVAKDNECSLLRDTDPDNAYFDCHTDITIPYDELEAITSIHADGTETDIIRDGRFVLAGCEMLNEPFADKAD